MKLDKLIITNPRNFVYKIIHGDRYNKSEIQEIKEFYTNIGFLVHECY